MSWPPGPLHLAELGPSLQVLGLVDGAVRAEKTENGEHVRAIKRIVADGESIAHMQNYLFTPELIAEVCARLGVSHRPNGYRWWLSRVGCP